MLLALVAAGIVFFTKRTSPSIRYNLLTSALLLFMISISVTIIMQSIATTPVAQMTPEMIASPMTEPQPGAAALVGENKLSLTDKAADVFNANAAWIVFTWLLIIVLRCVYLTFGLYGVYQLKGKQTFLAGEYWNDRLVQLCRQLQIHKRVRLLQTGITGMPSVIGYFKPVILFPVGMLVSLPPDEVEAILIHELAHIRRKDFLVNVLQQVVEIIFFFNPAVRWVSSLIRLERENCCDEIAVSQTGNKRNYINALIAFQGYDLRLTLPLANAFATEKNHLMNRVKRIIYNHNKTLNNMEKKFLALGMLITGVFIFAFSPKNLQSNKIEDKTRTQNNSIAPDPGIPATQIVFPGSSLTADTIPAKDTSRPDVLNGTINTTLKGTRYKIEAVNDQVTELYVNGRKIPAEKMAGYKSVVGKILEQSRLDMVESKKDMQEAQKEMEASKIDQQEAEKDMIAAKLEMEKEQEEMVREKEQSKIEMEQEKKEMALEMKETNKEIEQSKKDMQEAQKEMEETKKEMEKVKKDMAQSKRDMAQSKKDMEQSKRSQVEIINDFIKEKIIEGKKELTSYKLSNDELIVNGVKQPAAIHKRFKDKYVKGNNWSIEYNYSEDEK